MCHVTKYCNVIGPCYTVWWDTAYIRSLSESSPFMQEWVWLGRLNYTWSSSLVLARIELFQKLISLNVVDFHGNCSWIQKLAQILHIVFESQRKSNHVVSLKFHQQEVYC